MFPTSNVEGNFHGTLPRPLPLLLIGHGTRDADGRQAFLDFATAYQHRDRDRPVIPCFLELTEPTIAQGVEQCLAQGYTEMTAVPLLLFAARHSKFDVTNELDRIRDLYPQVKYRYGRHLGITPNMLDLWRDRLAELDLPEHNPHNISRQDTVLLFVGRGSSDPDANSDVCKVARILWEGSGYKTAEVCFIGITHPRLEEGFQRAMFYKPRRIIVLPYFLFTGALVKKIFAVSEQMCREYIGVGSTLQEIANLAEIGIDDRLFDLLRDREIEAQQGEVKMNCELCKFRLAAVSKTDGHDRSHGHHHHGQAHEHHHESHHGHHEHHHHSQNEHQEHTHDILWQDTYLNPDDYHARAWQVP